MFSRRAKASLLILALASSLFLGVAIGAWTPQDDAVSELRKNVQIFRAVYEELVAGYVKPVDPDYLMRVGIDAMLNELDPYTRFLDETDNASLDMITKGRYGGVGLEVDERGEQITVVAPVDGASGSEHGVRAGDVLTQIDDRPVAPLSVDEVETLLRGTPGTTVEITVEREGTPDPIEFTLPREEIVLENVTYRGRVGSTSDVGYVKLERFTHDAAPELTSALQALTEQDDLKGVVLDLRDNPGGLLTAAVGVADLFLKEDAVIVSTDGRLSRAESTYRSRHPPLLPDLPLVVLVNEESASASEIVAGAIQDHDRGVVMGTTTYGKGLVQAIRSLPHNTSLKMTTAQYHTPSGRSIQALDSLPAHDTSTTALEQMVDTSSRMATHETTHGRTVRDSNGLSPDVTVRADTAGALEQALTRTDAFFYFANHYAAARDTLPADFAVTDTLLEDFRTWLDDEDVRYSTDAERAIETLRGRFSDAEYASVQAEVAELEKAVRAEKRKAFHEHAPALKRHLEREILARFATDEQRTAELLPSDRQVSAAVELLHDDARYEGLLSPAVN